MKPKCDKCGKQEPLEQITLLDESVAAYCESCAWECHNMGWVKEEK